MKGQKIDKSREEVKEKILDDLRGVAEDLGTKSLSVREYNSYVRGTDMYSRKTIRYYFGEAWSDVLSEAGLVDGSMIAEVYDFKVCRR